MNMKTILVLGTFLFVLAGCNNNRNPELENKNAQLQHTNDSLNQNLASRDSYIDEVTQQINEVYANLESVRAKEKTILNKANELEAAKKVTNTEARQQVNDQIATISGELKANRSKINNLQGRLKSYKTQFAGLNAMVENLKQTLEEREQMLAQMSGQIKDLQQQVSDKVQMVTQRDSTIGEQQRVINTAFYAIGTRDELEKRGIIKKEGGFLWGLLGSTTTLASGFDHSSFKPIDKTIATTIEVSGKIDEILPKRNLDLYQQVFDEGSHSTSFKIFEPVKFWQDKYLVIITG
jgi:predicted  nucleic acid-binding Zn-ribbon protein